MTPEQLKASILQMAIQGKLVEQRAKEGTAEELYQQIQKEKQKLIKEGKIKKEKALEDIKEDEVPFDIPESWKWCYIGELFLHNTGKAQNASGSQNGVIRKFITTSNLYWNSFDFTKVKEMPFTVQELERCTVKEGDLLVCEGGDCGRSAVWNYDEEVCIQNHVHRLRPYKELDIYYFYYIFYLYKNTGRLRGRGVAIQGLSNEAIHRVLIPLPPLKEQHRIVAKIEELLPYVDRYAEAYEKLEQFNAKFPEDMKKSILQYAIQGKLVEQRPEEGTAEELYQQIQKEKQKLIKEGKIKKEKPLEEIKEDEIPFEIPESWKWVRLRSLGVFSSGKTPNMGEDKYWKDGTVSWITSKDMKKKYLETSEMLITEIAASEMRVYPKETMLMVVRSGILKRLLPVSILKNDSTINQDIKAFSLYKPELVEYVYAVLKGMENHILHVYRKQVTTVDSLRFEEFQDMPIPIPPLVEQHRIVAKIEELLPYCDQLIK